MNKDDVIKFIDGKVYYYSDYINFLYKQLELKDGIIKEVREYIEEHTDKLKTTRIPKIDFNYKELLEILDKENNEQ